MRIVHVSYAIKPQFKDPHTWLKRINFFVDLLEEMSRFASIVNIDLIRFQGSLKKNEVEYHFLKPLAFTNLFPFRLNLYMRKLNPDVVFVHGLIFPLHVLWLRIFMKKSVKIVIQNHAEPPLKFHKAILQRIVDRFVSRYFFTSHMQAKLWLDSGQINDKNKVCEVMEAPSIFYPINEEKARMKTNAIRQNSYLWVGRLDKNKDPVTLLKAFQLFLREYVPARLYIILHHQEELLDEVNAVLASAPEISRRIFFVRNVQHDDMLYWFNSADFIVSTSHYEGSGLAVCEGMSCGCIPILTDIASFNMMTSNGEIGLIFKHGNIESLVGALRKSISLDIDCEREKVLNQYKAKLSSEAISKAMIEAIKTIM